MDNENLDEDQEEIINDDNSINTDKDKTESDDSNSLESDDNDNYKKRYSDSSREAKRLSNIHTSYRNVLKDNDYLLWLDKETGKAVTKQLFEDWYSTTDDYNELINIIKGWDDIDDNWNESNSIDRDAIVKEVRSKILQEQEEEQAQNILDKALEKYSPEVKDKFLSEFKDLLWKRNLTKAFAEKEIKKIILYYSNTKNKTNRNDEALSKLASSNIWGSKSKSITSMTIEKMNMMGIPSDRQKLLYPELFPNNKK